MDEIGNSDLDEADATDAPIPDDHKGEEKIHDSDDPFFKEVSCSLGHCFFVFEIIWDSVIFVVY